MKQIPFLFLFLFSGAQAASSSESCEKKVVHVASEDSRDMILFKAVLLSGTLTLKTNRSDVLKCYKYGADTGCALRTWNDSKKWRANAFGIVIVGKHAQAICDRLADRIRTEFGMLLTPNSAENHFDTVVAKFNRQINESSERKRFKPLLSIAAILIQDGQLYTALYHAPCSGADIIPQLKLKRRDVTDSRLESYGYGSPYLFWKAK